jgi:hypothetical protein
MEYKVTPTWEQLDRWDGWEDDELDMLHTVLGDTLKNLPRLSSIGTGTEKGIMSRTGLR